MNDLPGKPDIYVPRLRLAVFVHGCFWHGHDCVRGAAPKSNVDFWKQKLSGNVARDAEQMVELRERGIGIRVIWECQLDLAERECSAIARRYKRHA